MAGDSLCEETAEPGDDIAQRTWAVEGEERAITFRWGTRGGLKEEQGAFPSFIQHAFIVLSSVLGPGDTVANTRARALLSRSSLSSGQTWAIHTPAGKTSGAEGHSRKVAGTVAPGEKAPEWGTRQTSQGRCSRGRAWEALGWEGWVEGPINAQAPSWGGS